MFKSNKYSRWYFQLISNAQQRPLPNTYNEKHHIIPKCLGGSNKGDNIVILTGREHFIAHLLLVKMTEGLVKRKMLFSLKMMTVSKGETPRYSSKTFEYFREQISKAKSESMKGRPAHNKGVSPSPNTKNKMSLSAKQPHRIAKAKEALKLATIANLGRVLSDETKSKISQSNKGQPKTLSARKSMSAAKKGKKWVYLPNDPKSLILITKEELDSYISLGYVNRRPIDLSGSNNPMFGKRHSTCSKQKMKTTKSGDSYPKS